MRYVMTMAAVLATLGLVHQLRAQEPKTGQSIALDILFADFAPAAGDVEITAAKIVELDRQGKLSSGTRIKLSLLENSPASVQFGESVAVAAGQQGFGGPGGRGGGAMYVRQNVGTTVQATARVEADGSIVVELTAERSGLSGAKPAADAADAATAEPQRLANSNLRSTLRLASGKPVIVGGQQSTAGKEAAGSYLVVTASLPEGAKAAAAAPAVVIKVFALTHARASDVIKSLRPVLDQRISFAADERTNSIIAQGSVEQLETANALIQKLDES